MSPETLFVVQHRDGGLLQQGGGARSTSGLVAFGSWAGARLYTTLKGARRGAHSIPGARVLPIPVLVVAPSIEMPGCPWAPTHDPTPFLPGLDPAPEPRPNLQNSEPRGPSPSLEDFERALILDDDADAPNSCTETWARARAHDPNKPLPPEYPIRLGAFLRDSGPDPLALYTVVSPRPADPTKPVPNLGPGRGLGPGQTTQPKSPGPGPRTLAHNRPDVE